MKKIILLNLVALLSAAYGSGPPLQVRDVPFPYPTIQKAIAAANDGDTVVVHPGTYTGEGNCDIDFLGKAITVRSEDPDEEGIVAATIIDCLGTSEDPHRAFILQSGEDANSIINGFTIMNGYVRVDGPDAGGGETEGGPGQNSYGGAINCTDSSPTIRNCIIRNCVAEGGKGGNGLPGEPGQPGDPNDANEPGVPPTEGGPGGNAGSSYGGAIYCDPYSGPTILNCHISNCSALGGEGGTGGTGGTGGEPNDPNAPDGTPGSSDANGYGGGIYIAAGSTATVTDCFFIDCNAVAGGAGESRGGALYYGTGYSGAFTGDANSCEAGYGAGIYCDANCTFALAGNTFAGGTGKYGAGVYCDANCVLTMDDCLVIDGTGDSGSGIYFGADCNATISNVDILHHTATADGAGLYCGSNGVLTLNNCNVMQSEAMGAGGAIYCDSDGELTLNKCNVVESTATGKGGAIYCDSNSVLDFHDCNITQSTAEGNGGGIYYAGGPAVTLNNCGLNDNHSLYGYGGFIYGGDPTTDVVDTNVVIVNCAIGNNSAQYGGAICLSGTNSVLTDSSLNNNTAEYGGGAFWYRSEVSINNCAVSDNSAEGATYCSGGGLYCLDCSLSIRNSDMVGNSAIGFGGGVFIIGPNLPGGTQELKNCLITDNTTGLDGAGLSCNVDAVLKMTNCTVVGNQVLDFDGSGGGISCYAASVEIIDSILWNNAAQYGAQIAIGDPRELNNPPATVMLTYSDVQGGEEYVFVGLGDCMLDWGEGNIELNPLFAEGYHLNQIEAGNMVNSPCVDAGSESAEALGLHKYTTRTDGVPDINIVDIGYHYRMQRVPCDCDLDGDVDMLDIAAVFSYWLEGECDGLDDCQGADSNLDTDVNFLDYAICAQAYTPPDKAPPEPDPSTWADEPHAIKDPFDSNSNSISMTATTAYDESGVEYLFECTDQNGVVLHDSGWQNSPTYVDTGLSGDTIYTYKVRTRDRSPAKNKGAWSVEAWAVLDRTPPAPNPSQWETPPGVYYDEETQTYRHGMQAEAASDPGGVQYYFFCAGGGHSSGWQDSPQYSWPYTEQYLPYSYKVMTRDKSLHQNEGAYSEWLVVESNPF